MNVIGGSMLDQMEPPIWDEEPNELVKTLIPEARGIGSSLAGTAGNRSRVPDRVGEETPYQRRAHLKKPIMSREERDRQQARAERIKKKLERKEKWRRCLELRKTGATYEQIAQVVGYKSPQTVSKIVRRLLEETTSEAGEELRTLQIERLNHMMLVLWPKVNGGDLNAIDRFLRIQNEINQLQGVYAPTKTENHNKTEVAGGVLVIEGDKDDYIRALQQMAGHDPKSGGPKNGPKNIAGPAGELPAGDQGDLAGGVVDADEIEEADVVTASGAGNTVAVPKVHHEEFGNGPRPVHEAPPQEEHAVTGPVACDRFVVSIDPKDQIRQKCGGCGLPRYKH